MEGCSPQECRVFRSFVHGMCFAYFEGMLKRTSLFTFLRGLPMIAIALFAIATAVQVGCSDSKDSSLPANDADASASNDAAPVDDGMTEDNGTGYGYGYNGYEEGGDTE